VGLVKEICFRFIIIIVNIIAFKNTGRNFRDVGVARNMGVALIELINKDPKTKVDLPRSRRRNECRLLMGFAFRYGPILFLWKKKKKSWYL